MTAMELLDAILKAKRKNYHWLGAECGESESLIYNRKKVGDLKVSVFKRYVEKLGCEIVIRDLYSTAEWRLK